jgi:hypothetical protein
VDSGLLERLADRGLGDGLAEVDGAPGTPQLPLSVRRISRMSPASLTTTTLTEGTRLLGVGASGES